jgi:hypothetical protein
MHEGIYVGFSVNHNAYIIYEVSTEKLIITRDVKFYENKFTQVQELKNKEKCTTDEVIQSETINDDTEESEKEIEIQEEQEADAQIEVQEENKNNQDGIIVPLEVEHPIIPVEIKPRSEGRGGLRSNPKQTDHGVMVSASYTNKEESQQDEKIESIVCYSSVANLLNESPSSYTQAMQRSDAGKWDEAAKSEIKSLESHGAWILVDRPKDKQVIGSRWIFKIKTNSDGTIEKYKARFVAKGYNQTEGIDYFETFSPTLKYKTFRVLLSLTTGWDYELKQLDVDTAFLYADIMETVYMEQPEGFTVDGENKVCLLKKALYGTHQAPRNWNQNLDEFIINKLNYSRSITDPCLYYKTSNTNKIMILTVFVDDIQSAYHINDESEWLNYKDLFNNKYSMKDIGDSTWILGMQIIRDRVKKELYVDQELYVNKIIQRFRMQDSNSIDIPEDNSGVLNTYNDSIRNRRTSQEENIVKQYGSLVGSLLYAAISTRIDIAHAVHQLSKHMQSPSTAHWNAGKRVLKYLKGSSKYRLKFNGIKDNTMVIEAFSDADWGNDKLDRKSTSGIIVKLNGDLISWSSKKQNSVATSTCEAEYIAMASVVQEVIWLKQLLTEIGMEVEPQVIVHCDNKAAIIISDSSTLHDRSKHIDIKYHFIRDEIKKDIIKVEYISTDKQQADILTKAINGKQFNKFREILMSK